MFWFPFMGKKRGNRITTHLQPGLVAVRLLRARVHLGAALAAGLAAADRLALTTSHFFFLLFLSFSSFSFSLFLPFVSLLFFLSLSLSKSPRKAFVCNEVNVFWGLFV